MATVSAQQVKFKAPELVSLALFLNAHYAQLRQHAINVNLLIPYLQTKRAVFAIKPEPSQEMRVFVPQIISNITILAIFAQLLIAYHALRIMFVISA